MNVHSSSFSFSLHLLILFCLNTQKSLKLHFHAFVLISDTYQAHQRNPTNSGLRIPQKIPLEVSNSGVSPNEVANENVDGADIFGTGLQNDIGEYNCFLNVIIQVYP